MTDEMKAKREKLFSSPKNGYDLVDQAALDAMETYCESYKQYLDNGKTERECAAYTVELAQAQGYVPYQRGMSLKPGDKVYRVNRGKSVMLVKIGRQDLSHGAQIVACHIDSPRLDFKPHPLYEDSELAYGKTHYYGGIRKYQWVAIPLELRGVVVLRDGEKVELNDVTWGTYTGTEGETYQGYGVYIARDQIEEANLWTILKTSWLNTIDFVRIVRLSLQMLVTGQAGMDDLSGPVGIVSTITQVGTASETIAAAVENILYFGAMLAVNLAVMNMLPIPALDGGKIFFLIIDEIAMKLFRKKIPEKYEMAVNTVGFVALMGFMLVVTFNDVFKLFG